MSYFIGAMFLLLLWYVLSVGKKAVVDLMAAERKLTEDLRKDLAAVRKILDQLIEAVEVSEAASNPTPVADKDATGCAVHDCEVCS